MNFVTIQSAPFMPEHDLSEFRRSVGDIGAVASFAGYCRAGVDDARVAALELEHYPGFSARIIEQHCARIAALSQAPHWRVVHRVGLIAPGEAIVLVAAASAHRAEALAAVERMIDWLKTDAPFWKREHLLDGAQRWIEPTQNDHARRASSP